MCATSVIGRGSFGTVSICSENETWCVKRPRPTQGCEAAHLKEWNFYQLFQTHPFVPRLIEASRGHLTLERANASLDQTIGHTREESDIVHIVACVCQIIIDAWRLMQWHHRDIKPANILLGPGSAVRVCDWGLVSGLPANNQFSTCQSFMYRSPEVILKCRASETLDMWSIGVLICDLFRCGYWFIPSRLTELSMMRKLARLYTGQTIPAWPEADSHKLWQQVLEEEDITTDSSLIRGPLLSLPNASPEACDFVTGCLQLNPQGRWHWSQILQHPWFQKHQTIQLSVSFTLKQSRNLYADADADAGVVDSNVPRMEEGCKKLRSQFVTWLWNQAETLLKEEGVLRIMEMNLYLLDGFWQQQQAWPGTPQRQRALVCACLILSEQFHCHLFHDSETLAHWPQFDQGFVSPRDIDEMQTHLVQTLQGRLTPLPTMVQRANRLRLSIEWWETCDPTLKPYQMYRNLSIQNPCQEINMNQTLALNFCT